MNRRHFLRNTSLTGLSITTLGLGAIAGTGTARSSQLIPGEDFKLLEATIDQLQKMMKSGEYTSKAITEMYLKRIKEMDKKGPELNSIIELNPDALLIAQNLDFERTAGKIRSPLHGIPILVKDNINSKDNMMTTAGALALEGNKAPKDAFIIQQLREAGAVLLGKTNLSEWANFRSSHSSSGWSSRGGQTKNPYILERNPSGSSSGSGAAVAASLCAIAIGSETDGSITAPSSYCGIVGLKPTVGLWSRSGIIPISKTQDTAGPMGRTVRDVAILLGALTGTDSEDPASQQSEGKFHKDYTTFLDANSLQGKRIGIEKSYLTGNEYVVALYNQAIAVLKSKGATVIEIELIKSTRDLGDAELNVLKYEFKDGVNKYLAKNNAKVKSLAEVIAFNKAHEAKAMPWFKQDILESCQEKGDLNSKEYLDALQKSTSARKIIDDLMKLNNLDALCSTTIGPANLTDLINGDYDTGFYFGSPAAMAGYPHITVPMGFVHELPVGFSFVSGAYKEGEIFGMAYAYEQATKKRKAPQYLSIQPK